MEKKLKICFVSSSGGHWEELMCLKEIARKYDSFFITEEGGQADDSKLERLYTFPQINRDEQYFIIKFIKLFYQSWKIMKSEKPDVLITTGALLSFPFCFVSKIMGCKLIYIESFARIYNPSLTGRIVYKFADLFLVQWKSMLKVYPKAKYVGTIF